ncbi:MAG TPA: metalloregulator ArsR/SmtB family transcription factor [Bacteroidia bacterium]|nr:metalloregulator ArsR/SmtB family transcription factor [Bacteroidia bacterium]
MMIKLDLKKVEKISKALGDPYRLKIMEMVKKQRDCLQCTAILEMVDLAQSTVSHHVKQLVDADLLIAGKDGRNASYQINKEVLSAYIRFLNQYES